MPTQLATFEAKKGFNSVYHVVENCDIEIPVYEEGFSTGKFFFTRRQGIASLHDTGETAVGAGRQEDTLSFQNLVVTNDGANGFVKEFDDAAIANAQLSSVGGVGSFSVSPDLNIQSSAQYSYFPGGTMEAVGTSTSGTTTSITDTTQTWAVNQFAGFYVWIVSGTGAGNFMPIKSNTSNTIVVDGWLSGLSAAAASEYRVYTLTGSSPVFSSQTDVKNWIHDGTNMVEVQSISFSVKIAEEWDGRMFYVSNENPNIVWYSYVGHPFAIKGFLDTGLGDILTLKSFGQHLVVGKTSTMKSVFNYNQTSDNEAAIYNVKDLLSNTGMKSARAATVWKGNFYFLADDSRLYTLNIDVSAGTVSGSISDISETISLYLTEDDTDPASAYFSSTGTVLSLYINRAVSGTTTVLRLDSTYEGWLVNKHDILLSDFKVYGGQEIICSGTNIGRIGGNTDLGTTYLQRATVLFGLDNQHSLKTVNAVKFVIKYTEKNVLFFDAKTVGNYAGTKFGKIISDESTTGLGIGAITGTVGQNLLGTNVLGGVAPSNDTSIHEMRVTVNKSGNFFRFNFSDNFGNGFTLGDVLVIYSAHNPMITSKITSN